jgi:hypothetical protein
MYQVLALLCISTKLPVRAEFYIHIDRYTDLLNFIIFLFPDFKRVNRVS